MAYKNKCSDLPKDRERYGTFPIFGETKNEYGAPAPAGKANVRFGKTKQMQRCNPPRFKTNRRTRGSRNHVIPYFEGFTIAAICQDQSERSLFHGTENEWNVNCNVAKAGGQSVAHGVAPYCYFWGRDDNFYARHGKRAARDD